MFLLKNVFIVIFFVTFTCANVLKHEDDNTIFKDSEDLPIKKENFDLLRYDLDNVAVNMENFVVDVLKQFLFNQTKQPNENSSEETNTEETTIEQATNVEETTNYEDTTTTEETISTTTEFTTTTEVNNIIDTPKNIETTTLPPNKRSRRVRRQTECTPKTLEELRLEKLHIQDLNKEVKKLNDLVVLLRDQRDILHILNEDSNTPNKFLKNETKETLIKGLKKLNQKELDKSKDEHVKSNEIPLNEANKPTHKELEHLKNQLCETVRQLNETRQLLKLEQLKENSLAIELMNQKSDITNLYKLIKTITKTSTQKDTVLGASLTHHPKLIPQKPQNITTSTRKEQHHTEARASDLTDLAKILDTLNEPKRTQPTNDEILRVLNALNPPKSESKSGDFDLKTLQDTIEKKEREDRLKQIARLLQGAQSKSLVQGKSDDIDGRLKELQDAINRLKPRDEGLDLRPDDEARFQAMLSNLINNQGSTKPSASPGLSSSIFTSAPSGFKDTFSGRYPPTPGGFYGGYSPAAFAYGGFQSPQPYMDAYRPGYTPNVPSYPGYAGGYTPSSGGYSSGGFGGNYAGNYAGNTPSGAGYVPRDPNYTPNGPSYGSGGFSYAGGSTNYGGKSYYQKPPSVNPYDGKQTDFFLHQQNQYDKGPGGYNSPQELSYTTNQGKYGQNPAPASGGENIEDLKSQIYSLQTVINDLNRPEYTQKPEDKQTVYQLEKQIADLKNVVQDNSYGQPSYGAPSQSASPPGPSYDQNTYTPSKTEAKYRRKRDTEPTQTPDEKNNSENLLNTAALYLNQILQESPQSQTQQVNISNNETPRSVNEIQNRLNVLKKQLESHGSNTRSTDLYQTSYNNIIPVTPYIYPQNAYDNNFNKFDTHKTKIQEKKQDLFTDILLKLTDKLLNALPKVLHKIFGFSFEQLTKYDYGYDYGYGSSLSIFKNLGIFGYLPIIGLKLIDALTYFMNAIRKNKFLKKFLVPTLVLGLVAGSILFLIWFLSSDQENYDYKQVGYSNYDKNSYGYNNNNNYGYNNNNNYNNYDYNRNSQHYNRQTPNNNPVYSRSYFENIPQ